MSNNLKRFYEYIHIEERPILEKCPNCGFDWGEEEIDTQTCDNCYYPDFYNVCDDEDDGFLCEDDLQKYLK